MTTLNDNFFSALRALGFTGSLADMELAYYRSLPNTLGGFNVIERDDLLPPDTSEAESVTIGEFNTSADSYWGSTTSFVQVLEGTVIAGRSGSVQMPVLTSDNPDLIGNSKMFCSYFKTSEAPEIDSNVNAGSSYIGQISGNATSTVAGSLDSGEEYTIYVGYNGTDESDTDFVGSTINIGHLRHLIESDALIQPFTIGEPNTDEDSWFGSPAYVQFLPPVIAGRTGKATPSTFNTNDTFPGDTFNNLAFSIFKTDNLPDPFSSEGSSIQQVGGYGQGGASNPFDIEEGVSYTPCVQYYFDDPDGDGVVGLIADFELNSWEITRGAYTKISSDSNNYVIKGDGSGLAIDAGGGGGGGGISEITSVGNTVHIEEDSGVVDLSIVPGFQAYSPNPTFELTASAQTPGVSGQIMYDVIPSPLTQNVDGTIENIPFGLYYITAAVQLSDTPADNELLEFRWYLNRSIRGNAIIYKTGAPVPYVVGSIIAPGSHIGGYLLTNDTYDISYAELIFYRIN